jgi:hypothetical protein
MYKKHPIIFTGLISLLFCILLFTGIILFLRTDLSRIQTLCEKSGGRWIIENNICILSEDTGIKDRLILYNKNEKNKLQCDLLGGTYDFCGSLCSGIDTKCPAMCIEMCKY